MEALIVRDPDALILAVDETPTGTIELVGTVMAGWDGWRCHIYRLAIAPDRRRTDIARPLIQRAWKSLRSKRFWLRNPRRAAAPTHDHWTRPPRRLPISSNGVSSHGARIWLPEWEENASRQTRVESPLHAAGRVEKGSGAAASDIR